MFMKIAISVLFIIFTISLRAQWRTSYAPHFRDVNAALVLNSTDEIMLVGGHLSNDSIRSVFLSTDTGNTWGVPLDIPGESWLKCVAKVSSSKFIVAGYTGNIMKSVDGGHTWNTLANLPFTGSNLRLYNSVFFVDGTTGYIAGGLVDSLQTILKTTDGGNTWAVQRDTLGYWLSSIFFANNSLGWAVGKNGTFLKTVDGGVNWQLIPLSGDMGNRTLNAVFFTTPERGIIVGGIKDSLQTVLSTIDGGNTWYFTIDNNGEMLNAIDFVDTLSGYIAGDNCTVLTSSDGGTSWGQADVPAAYIEDFDLRAVNFYDHNFGVFAGESGKYLVYKVNPPTPLTISATTLAASAVDPISAHLNAEVGVLNNNYAVVKFQFGTTTALGSELAANIDTILGGDTTNVYAILQYLYPSTLYYFRVVAYNAVDTIYGETDSFSTGSYTGECMIPNCDFEYWTEVEEDCPPGWIPLGRTRKVISYNRSNAIEISSVSVGNPGAISYGFLDHGLPWGMRLNGTSIPDSLVFYAKYNIEEGDTAWALLAFKKDGVVIDTSAIPIIGYSGNSFVRISRAISSQNAEIPDTALVGFTNTNSNLDVSPYLSSVLAIDDVQFVGGGNIIPGGDMETLVERMGELPVQWQTQSQTPVSIRGIIPVQRVNDRVSGQYAIRLQSDVLYNKFAQIYVGNGDETSTPAFPAGRRYSSFNGYLKFEPVNGDTLYVDVSLFKNGMQIGSSGQAIFDIPVLQWMPFSFPLQYQNETDVPDSVQIVISLGRDMPHGNSVAYIDNISFDGFHAIDSSVLAIKEPDSAAVDLFTVYPNPANTVLNVAYYNIGKGETTVSIVDLQGRIVVSLQPVLEQGLMNKSIDISNLANGVYMVNVESQQSNINRRFSVAK